MISPMENNSITKSKTLADVKYEIRGQLARRALPGGAAKVPDGEPMRRVLREFVRTAGELRGTAAKLAQTLQWEAELLPADMAEENSRP